MVCPHESWSPVELLSLPDANCGSIRRDLRELPQLGTINADSPGILLPARGRGCSPPSWELLRVCSTSS
jgi:hypothetical protein